jgi:hypothetical protein
MHVNDDELKAMVDEIFRPVKELAEDLVKERARHQRAMLRISTKPAREIWERVKNVNSICPEVIVLKSSLQDLMEVVDQQMKLLEDLENLNFIDNPDAEYQIMSMDMCREQLENRAKTSELCLKTVLTPYTVGKLVEEMHRQGI